MDAAQYVVVEGTLRRRIATLEATGRNPEELDAARALLAEALWRSGRPVAAYEAVAAVRPRGVERRRTITMMVEAEGLAAIGEQRQAEGLLERVVNAVGGDEAWRLRRGAPSRLEWPSPSWSGPCRAEPPMLSGRGSAGSGGCRVRRGGPRDGRSELALALRRDPGIAPAGIALLEPELGAQPAAERLVLYGDLLRAPVESATPPPRTTARRAPDTHGSIHGAHLVLVKPDGVQRGLVGEIVGRFERKGLKLIGLRLLWVPHDMAERHYAVHAGKHFYPDLVEFITSGPVAALALAGPDAVAVVRRLVGQTMPNQADPGTVRGDLGVSGRMEPHPRLGRPETAETELALWFDPGALVDYDRAVDTWIMAEEPPAG